MSVKVSESTGYGPNTQMSLFGYVMAAILVIVLLPLIPVLVPAWILWKVFVSDEEIEHSFENWRRESGRTGSDRLEDDEAEATDAESAESESGDAESDRPDAEQTEADQTAAES
ncbi:hypothetical protein [Natrinema sp. 1APR25-10V2]|uniref:DUF7535 family protein n=1 Tax=Natrinema sp. 1APR25-10V2 TaxID=2951081 RepID=UPI002874B60B|nr:hypothetical protein [Natrinema sp. 1APR25-10V2]MDS0475035.1 hypothetical protein [Natrinema sp. 1APR25-10V2]